jgi:NADH-quinone oxidoreductase subunit M
MPLYGGIAVGIFFAGLGLPGLCGFIGEVFTVISSWSYSRAMAVIAASGVILTAGYILWTIQRVFLGPEYKGPHGEDLRPANGRELTIGFILLGLAILLGVFPALMFNLMEESTRLLTDSLAAGYSAMHQVPPQVTSVVGK